MDLILLKLVIKFLYANGGPMNRSLVNHYSWKCLWLSACYKGVDYWLIVYISHITYICIHLLIMWYWWAMRKYGGMIFLLLFLCLFTLALVRLFFCFISPGTCHLLYPSWGLFFTLALVGLSLTLALVGLAFYYSC